MKLRNPLLISLAARIIASFIRIWVGTCRYHYVTLGPWLNPTKVDLDRRYIFAFWHENLLGVAQNHGRPNIHVLISKHADGELIAQVAQHLSMRTIRGSSTRGGVEALRTIIKMPNGHIAVTPDGPRGPRRRVQSGLVFLAAKTSMPVVCWGVGYDRPWRAKSWDRFCVPRPFHSIVGVSSSPIVVPRDADRDMLEKYREKIQQQMDYCAEQAELMAAGKLPICRAAQRRAA
jgi:lysophospholipid acyltransferase (LPLAT)-like uncharacterized protein